MLSDRLRFHTEELVRRKREHGKPIDATALANEIAAALPNYRHMKKRIRVLVVEAATAINRAELASQFAGITSQFVKKRGGRPRLS